MRQAQKRQRGMTLMETMIAMGIASGLMLVVSQLVIYSQKSTKSVEMTFHFNEFGNLLRLSLEKNCLGVFNGSFESQGIDLAGNDWKPTGSGSINLDRIRLAGQTYNTGLNNQYGNTGLRFTKLELSWEPPDAGATSYIATLLVEVEKGTEEQVLGNRKVSKPFSINLIGDAAAPHNVRACTGGASGEAIVTGSSAKAFYVVSNESSADCPATAAGVKECIETLAGPVKGTVLIKSGTYTGVGPITVPEGVTVIGEKDTVLQASTFAGAKITLSSNTELRGLIFDQSTTTTSSTIPMIEIPVAVTNVTIQDSIFRNPGTTRRTPIIIGGSGNVNNPPKHILIKNNKFGLPGDAFNAAHVVRINSGLYIKIHDNNFDLADASIQQAIIISAPADGKVGALEVIGNTGANMYRFITLNSTGSGGLYSLKVLRNRIDGVNDFFYAVGGGNEAHDLEISQNIMNENLNGRLINFMSGAVFNGIKITNNSIECSPASTTSIAIHVFGYSVQISDNRIIYCNRGISLQSMKSSTVANNHIYFEPSWSQATTGIELGSSHDVRLVSNVIENPTFGISTQLGVGSAYIGNVIKSSNSSAITKVCGASVSSKIAICSVSDQDLIIEGNTVIGPSFDYGFYNNHATRLIKAGQNNFVSIPAANQYYPEARFKFTLDSQAEFRKLAEFSATAQFNALADFKGKAQFTTPPTGTSVADSMALIQPTGVIPANASLFGVRSGGLDRFRIDEDGDVSIRGGLTLGDTSFSAGATGNVLYNCTWNRKKVDPAVVRTSPTHTNMCPAARPTAISGGCDQYLIGSNTTSLLGSGPVISETVIPPMPPFSGSTIYNAIGWQCNLPNFSSYPTIPAATPTGPQIRYLFVDVLCCAD